jgi:uncharacterized protein (DUF952 family)
MILHIAHRQDWETALADSHYTNESLATEGFIHCSLPEQVLGPANELYHGQTDLLLLVIDPELLEADLVYEDTIGAGQNFPHIYGPLNLDAVTQVVGFPPQPDGSFVLPVLD